MREQSKRFQTPDDARHFDGYSVANAALVLGALTERGCSCEPYQDVYTFARWRAQNRTVRRGEHGIRLPVIVTGSREVRDDDGTAQVRAYKLLRTSCVFCRCQTDEIGGRK